MVKERLELDLTSALSALRNLDSVLSTAAVSFSKALNQAVSQTHTIKVTGDAKAVTTAIDKAVLAGDDSIAIHADALGVTSAITAAVNSADTSIEVKVDDGGDLPALKQNLEGAAGAGSQLVGVGKSLKTTLAGLGLGLGIGQVLGFFNDSVQAASNLGEAINKTNVFFEGSAKTILDWSKTSSSSVLLARRAALEAAGGFGSLFTVTGSTTDEAAAMSIKMVQLAADLASVSNIPVEDALLRLQSGLIGEAEPLRRLNVLINENAVAAKAQELGLAGVDDELSEGVKVQARYALILEQTKKQQGDVARTSDGLANSQRRTSAAFEDGQVKIGRGLLPAMTELFHALETSVIPAVTKMGVALGPVLGPLIEALIPVVTGLADAFTFVFNILGPVFDVLGPILPLLGLFISPLGLIIAGVNELGSVWDSVWPEVQRVLESVYQAIKGPILDPLGDVLDFIWGVIKKLSEIADGAFGGLSSAVETMWSVVKVPLNAMYSILKAIVDFIKFIDPSGGDNATIDEVISAAKGNVKGYAAGGYVGAGLPPGTPQLILAHAGEYVTPVGGQQMAGVGTLNVNVRLSGDGAGNPAVLAGITGAVERGVGSMLRDIVVSAGVG